MNQEPQQESMVREIELPGACLGCGGPVAARLTPGSARGVCRPCRAILSMTVERRGQGLQLVQEPAGEA
jgi:hypothetical protein